MADSIGFQSARLVGTLTRGTSYADYVGDYNVIPSVDPQELETADKKLSSNITIGAIPFYETSNEYGGETITIGGM